MTPDEYLQVARAHYRLTAAGDPAAQDLLTDDFVIAIPSFQPFAGEYRGT